MSIFDGQIAAIAQTTGFSLATRNIKDFEECGIELINPFDYLGGWKLGGIVKVSAAASLCRFDLFKREYVLIILIVLVFLIL